MIQVSSGAGDCTIDNKVLREDDIKSGTIAAKLRIFTLTSIQTEGNSA